MARMRAAVVATGLGALLSGAAWTSTARANPLPTSAAHVPAPGRSVAADETSDALVLNPANLAFLPAWELRWTWVHCPEDANSTGCGHAWAGAVPLPFNFATAFRVDLMQPPFTSPTVGVGFPYGGFDYTWLTWGLAYRISERLAAGISLERTYSSNSYLDGLFGITAALSWRPNSHFAFSGVARDFNRPSPTLIPPALGHVGGDPAMNWDGGDSLPVLDARYVLAMAFRPTGRRTVEIGVEGQYWGGTGMWTPRLTAGVDIPSIGRALASVEATHLENDNSRGVLATVGLDLHFGGLSAGGGLLFGNGLGSNGSVGEYVSAALAHYTQPGIPQPAHAVFFRLESTPTTREHVALLRQLWHIANNPSIDAVTLVLRAEPASSFAHAEELADAIRVLRAHHKKVLCSYEDAGSRSIYVCASADRIVVTPGGGVRYAGLKSEYMYLKGLLDKVGVKAEFVRVGPHKTAPEQFTNEHAGPVAREDHEEMLAQQLAIFDRNMMLYRHIPEQKMEELARRGPFVASEAREGGLVDGTAFDDEVERATKELVGRDVDYVKYEEAPRASAAFGPQPRIAILYLDGDITDGRSQHIPIVGIDLVGSYSMQETIKELRDDPSVRAVVLRIESPGGSSLASDVMWRELMLLRKEKPLIVSMGSVAASGGYYTASASKDIFALPLTVTGSIGVFYGKADVSGLLSKIGVTIDVYKTAPRADAESLWRGFTADEQRELEHKVDQFYDTFLERVHEGRGMAKADIDAVGRGRVWTGQQALERHLVDHIGGLREALAAAREAANLPDDAPIVEAPAENATLIEKALALVTGAREGAGVTVTALPPALREIARAIAPMVVYRADEPLARLEWVDVGDWQWHL